MNIFRTIIGALLLVFQFAPASALIHRGTFVQPPVGAQTVVNFDYTASETYLNIAKSLSFSLGSNTSANITADLYPTGVLAGNYTSNTGTTNTPALDQSYFGHYTFQWTGVSAAEIAQSIPIIIYNGGAGVFSVTPSGSGTSSGNTTFYNNANQTTNLSVELSFGVLISSVTTSVGGDACGAGLVKFGTPSGFLNSGISTGSTFKFDTGISGLATGPNSDGSYTITKLDAQTMCLNGSSASAGAVTITSTGGPGTQTEGIYNGPTADFIFNYLQSVPGVGNITHSVSNLIICKTGDLASINSNIVTTSIINTLTFLKPKYVRWMDDMQAQAFYSNFSDRRPVTNMTYQGAVFYASHNGGTSTNVSDAYTISNPSGSGAGAYADGEIAQFTSNHTSTTGFPTLQLGTRGAVPMYGFLKLAPLTLPLATSASVLTNSSVVGNGTIITVTTSVAHGLTNGAVYGITISGTVLASGCSSGTTCFNATYACTITGASTFTCPNTSGTGTAGTPGSYQVQTTPGDIISVVFNASYFPGSTHTFQYYVNTTAASITATIAAGTNVLNVTAVGSGTVTPGQAPNGSASLGIIQPYGTNSTTGTGGTGTYALSQGQTSLTNVTSSNGSVNGGNPDNNLSNLNGNMSAALAGDDTLNAAGFQCGNSGGQACYFIPSNGALSVTSSTSGAGTETITPYFLQAGNIATGKQYTFMYKGALGGFVDVSNGTGNGASGGGLLTGIPLEVIAEVATRTGIGQWLDVPLTYTQASYTSLGAWAAANISTKLAIEDSNEVWNLQAAAGNAAVNLGEATNLGGAIGSLAFRSMYSYYGLSVSQNLPAFASGYTGAGGTRNNLQLLMENWALDGLTNNPTDTSMVNFRWNGTNLGPATFTGTLGTTNGLNTVTVTGLSGALHGPLTITGSCVSGTTHIIRNLNPPGSYTDSNGTYLIDAVRSGGPCTVTASNPVYAAVGGPGGTSTSTNYNTFPTRPVDLVDAEGYAVYYLGALAGQGAGTWSGTQSFYNTLFTASANYAQGVATSNQSLINSALSAWDTDAVSGTKNSVAGSLTINAFVGQGAFTGAGAAVAPGFEAFVAAYDSQRIGAGMAKLNIVNYEGGLQETLCAGGACIGPTTTSQSPTDLNTQFTNNGWTSLDATYGYPGFGAGSSVTASNIVNLFLAYTNSTQYYHSHLCLMQETAAIHAARGFSPAQFGTDGPTTATITGSPLWGLYQGNASSTPLSNFNAQKDYNNGVTATCP